MLDTSFWTIDAESDKHLESYFYETKALNKVFDGTNLIVGRKGSGKTALMRKLLKTVSGNTCVELKLDETVVILRQIVTSLKNGGVELSTAYERAWTYVISVAFLQSSLKDMRWKERVRFNKIRKDVERESGFWPRISSVIFGYDPGMNAPNLTFQLQSPLSEDIDPVTLNKLIVALESLVKDVGKHVKNTVFVDDLDKYWADSPDKNFAIGGAVQVNRKFRNLGGNHFKNPASVICLRDDLWHQLDVHDKNKFIQTINKLDWDSGSLEKLINLRFRAMSGNPDAVWKDFFPSEIIAERQDALAYMLNHTMMRPRDLINFISVAIENAKGRDEYASTVSKDDIANAVKKYSYSLKQEILDEERGSDLAISECLRLIEKHGGTKISRKEFESLCSNEASLVAENADKYLEQLFRYGILGIKREGKTFLYIYSGDEDALNKVRDAESFQVHKGLKAALELKDKRSRKEQL